MADPEKQTPVKDVEMKDAEDAKKDGAEEQQSGQKDKDLLTLEGRVRSRRPSGVVNNLFIIDKVLPAVCASTECHNRSRRSDLSGNSIYCTPVVIYEQCFSQRGVPGCPPTFPNLISFDVVIGMFNLL